MMATLKVKNAAGEWVDVAAANEASSFKFAMLTSEDRMSFDLSPYVNSQDEFVLFFKLRDSYNNAINADCVYNRSCGDLLESTDRPHSGHYSEAHPLQYLFDVASSSYNLIGDFNEETCVLTLLSFTNTCYVSNALLMYAG